MKPPPFASRRSRRAQFGVGLIDGLIAIVILSFGLVGLSRMQGRMISAATDARFRTAAVALADEQLSTMLVDNANAPCYTYPTEARCTSAAAKAATQAWANRVQAAFPGDVSVTAVLDTGGSNCRMTVQIGWTSRLGAASEGDERLLTMDSDARGIRNACP
jgi:type IV pilus assembly protein PilV